MKRVKVREVAALGAEADQQLAAKLREKEVSNVMPKVVSSLGMTRRRKLIEKARNNPTGVRFQEICLLAEHLGFTKRGGKGSHVVYEKEGVEEILTFQDRKGMAKPYQVKQLLAVIDKYRLGE